MRKKTNILLLALIIICAAIFVGYRMLDAIRTDTKAPAITVSGDVPELSVRDSRDSLLQGVTATDDQDGDVTSSLLVENVTLLDSTGRINVSYAAFDNAGNVAKIQREARFTDYVSPRFTLSAPLMYRNGTSFDVLSTVGATDTFDGDIQHRIRATALGDTVITAMGTHDVRFQVTNSLGDTATIVIPVEVYDPLNYTASLTLKHYLVYLKAGDSFQPSTYLDCFTLSGKETKLSSSLPYGYSLQTIGEVDTETPGVYSLQYLVTYTEKSEISTLSDRKYTGYSKLIVVVEG